MSSRTYGHVRVNVINPGRTRTRMRAQAYPAEDLEHAAAARRASLRPYLWLLGPPAAASRAESFDCQPPVASPAALSAASSSDVSSRNWPRPSVRVSASGPKRVRSTRLTSDALPLEELAHVVAARPARGEGDTSDCAPSPPAAARALAPRAVAAVEQAAKRMPGELRRVELAAHAHAELDSAGARTARCRRAARAPRRR